MRTWIAAIPFVVLLAGASFAIAQPADEYVSGLLHQPVGAITTFSVTERRLTACCLGSSGEDGVEVQLHSVHGGGASVDITPMLGATGVQREFRIRPKGWDGTIKGNLRITSDPDGHVTEEYDFSTIGATSCTWHLMNGDGSVLAAGEVTGPVISWGLEVPDTGVACNKVYSFAPPSILGRSANQGFFDRVVTVTGLTPFPVTGVQMIEVTPVQPCAGCPNGPPWDDVQSIEITGDGVPDLVVADAHLRTFGVQSWGLGQAHLNEMCGTNGDCDDTDPALVADNLGSSGQDGVAIDFGSGASGGSLVRGRCNGCPFGHITLLKAYDDGDQEVARVTETSNPATGQGVLIPDFSAIGSTEFDVAYIGSDGLPLAVERCANGTPLDAPNPDLACSTGGHVWVFGGYSDVMELRLCGPSGPLTLPSGSGVSGVVRLRLRALRPTVVHHSVRRVALTSPDADPIVIEHASATKPIYVSGLPHFPTGGVSSLSVDGRRLTACCLGSSGEDGVEVELNSLRGGGASVDITPMLGATGLSREIRIRPKGWDGKVKSHMRISSDPDGHVTEEYDFSTIGATSLDWRLLNAHGGVLAEGSVGGAVVSWGLDIANTVGTWDKLYAFPSSATAARGANQGFFDRVVTVSGLTPDPVADVQMIQVTPVQPCAGCPNGPDWNDVRSIELQGDGMPDLVVVDAHLGTFDAACWGVGKGRIREECENPLLQCDNAHLRVVADNLGSSGQDGVAIDFGSSSTGGSVARSKRCPDCPPGHVTLIKFTDDAGSERFHVSQTENPLAGQVEMQVDASGMGATATRVTFLDTNGAPLGSAILDSVSVVQHDMSPPELPETWSCVGGRYILRAGIPLRFQVPGQPPFDGVDTAVFRPLNPTAPSPSSRMEITSNDPSGFVITSAAATPAQVGDVDRDGDVDLVDFSVMNQCLSGPEVSTRPPTCDALHFELADLDRDVDVDLADFTVFQRTPLSD